MIDFVDLCGAVTVRAMKTRKMKGFVGMRMISRFRERESAFTFRTDEAGDLD